MNAWQRNLAVLFFVQLLSTVGFSLIFPFLPLYVNELGAATGGSVEFWAGMVFSAQAATMMIFSPIWGTMADRRGRKLMLERATLGGALIVAAMGLVQNAEQLVILRTLQGAVTGVVAAANALVAAQTPKTHTGFALGVMNTARWGGVAAGPLLGGFIAETFGFRQSFWITGALLGLAGVCVYLFVVEDFTPVDKASRPSVWSAYRLLFAAPGMSGLYALTFLRSLGANLITPIVALFVLFLNQGEETGVAATTGLVIGAAALTSAVSAIGFGKLGDRIGHTQILVGAALGAALLHLPQAWATAPWQLILLQALSGIAVGGLVPSVAALMNLWSPPGNQGVTYGMDNSVQASARVVAPMLAASLVALVGYRGIFLSTASVYLVIAAVAIVIVRRAQLRTTVEQPVHVSRH